MPTIRLPSLPLWEERWNREALIKKKAAGERAFARGFHLQAYSDEERMFRSFPDCFQAGLRLDEVMARRYPAYVGVDLAGKKRPGNAIFVTGLAGDGTRYPLEVLRGAWSSPETAARLAEINLRHDVRIIMVENNAYQGALVDWIRQAARGPSDMWTKVEEYTTTAATKTHHEIGLPALEVEFKNRAWAIPTMHPPPCEAGPACACPWCTWKREVADYPMSATSDCLMACFFSREAISRWGALTARQANIADLSWR